MAIGKSADRDEICSHLRDQAGKGFSLTGSGKHASKKEAQTNDQEMPPSGPAYSRDGP